MTAAAKQNDSPEVLQLIERGAPMVERIAKRIRGGLDSSYQLEDLIAAGKVGLLQVARSYDPSHGVAFEAFAYHRIQGEIYNEVGRFSNLKGASYRRAAALQAATASCGNSAFESALQLATQDRVEDMSEAEMEQAVDTVLGNVTTATAVGLLRPSLEEDVEVAANSDQAQELEKRQLTKLAMDLLDELDPSDAELFRDTYLGNKSYREVVKELGLSLGWIHRRNQRVLSFLQERMAQLEPG